MDGYKWILEAKARKKMIYLKIQGESIRPSVSMRNDLSLRELSLGPKVRNI